MDKKVSLLKLGEFLATTIYFCALFLSPASTIADSIDNQEIMASYRSEPLSLTGGGRLMLISPKQWFPLAEKLSRYVSVTHEQFTKLYGTIPAVETTLRLVDADQFYHETGAPGWTNAMYYRGEITIPLSLDEPIELDDLYRSIRHEYTHSVINTLSAGRCPGWLDEGLAQWAEGTINPALEPSLRKWLYFNKPISLDLLQGGFTKLESRMVAPAYGQSLFAAQSVMSTFGFDDIRSYFKLLRNGESKSDAFGKSFEISETQFESSFGKHLKNWAYGPEHLNVSDESEATSMAAASTYKIDAHRGELERMRILKNSTNIENPIAK